MSVLDFDSHEDDFHPTNRKDDFENDPDLEDLDIEDENLFEDDLDEDYFENNISDFEKEGDIEDIFFGIEPGREENEFDDDESVDFDEEF